MPIENQDETVAFLTSPAAFGSSLATVRIVQTHISLVILSGERAIKLKRAVRLPYVDFSTAERRLAICQQELVLNRLTAPELYRAVHKVTREPDGSLALNGTGVLVDAVAEMVRFDEDGLFDRLAIKGALTTAMPTRLAHQIAEFHKSAAVDRSPSAAVGMASVLAINESARPAVTAKFLKSWCRLRDSNTRPHHYECSVPLESSGSRAGKHAEPIENIATFLYGFCTAAIVPGRRRLRILLLGQTLGQPTRALS